jgi:Restriction endonuclease
MNPAFELDQIHRYLDHLRDQPGQLASTAESHFFPVLQRIFMREAFEVRTEQQFLERSYPFLLVDLDRKRPNVFVDFAYTVEGQSTMIPGPILDAVEASASQPRAPSFLVLRNQQIGRGWKQAYGHHSGRIRFLDFSALKIYASEAFALAEKRETHRALVIVRDMIEALIAAIAAENIDITDIEWRDLERLVHQTLRGLGFHAHLTPPGKDGGRDVLACDILLDDVHWYNIEIKHWRDRSIGRNEAAATLETAIFEGRRGALLLSPRRPSPAALSVRTEVHRDFLRFGSRTNIVHSCQHYVSNRDGFWKPAGGLRSFLFEGTD